MQSLSEIRRSTTMHFLPGIAVFYAGYLFIAGEVPYWQGFALMGAQVGGLILGYRLALGAGKERLRHLSRIRAVAAGFTAPMLLGLGLLPLRWGKLVVPGETFEIFASSAAMGIAAGAFLAATMFIRGRRPELSEPAVAGELAGESLEDWFRNVERRADELVKRFTAGTRQMASVGLVLLATACASGGRPSQSTPACDYTVVSIVTVRGTNWADQLNDRQMGLGADGWIDLSLEYAPGDATRRPVGATATLIRYLDPECPGRSPR